MAPAIETKRLRTRGTVVIDVEACKGCDLCIDACPPGVLSMTVQARNERGYRYPELHPGCTACQACSQVCPDFVFQVWKFETPVDEAPVDNGEAGVGHLLAGGGSDAGGGQRRGLTEAPARPEVGEGYQLKVVEH